MSGRLMFALVALVAARPAFADVPAPAKPAPDAPPAATAPAPAGDPPPAPSPDEPAPPADGDPDAPPAVEEPAAPDADAPDEHERLERPEFGPVIQIERIEILGNTATQTEVIRRALPVSAGDVLHASDKRLREARFKVLSLGFFSDVAIAIRKGSLRGQVVLEIRVVERGTLVLNRLWFGTTDVAPWWLGADVGDRNLFGLGIAIGGGFIYAGRGDPVGARDQYAAELRLSDPSVQGTRWGASVSATLIHGSEPYRVSGEPNQPTPDNHHAFPYRRLGIRLGTTYGINALTRLTMGLRVESIDATLPTAPTRTVDGTVVPIDLHLDPGASRVVTGSLAFDRDTRPDPILPHAGGHILLSAELGTALLGSDYDFATLFGSYEHYWPVNNNRHAIGLKLAGGLVIGDAPRFDRIHIADVDHMLTPRALGLVLSTAAPFSILATGADIPSYGDIGGSATIEYALQVFRGRGKRRVYGSDVFIGGGVWGLAERSELRTRDTSLVNALPIDAYLDAGVRLDTDIGTFELTFANALGRLR